MSEIRDLKCHCCKCWDSFDGCQAFDCQYDFEISINRVKEAAKEYSMSVDAITAILLADEERRLAEKAKKSNEEGDILPKDFNPYCDSKFLVAFADSPNLGNRLLVEMDPDDLHRLRAEIDNILKPKEIE